MKNHINSTIVKTAFLLLPIVLLATLFYSEALFSNKSVIHGDAISHGYPVFDIHASVLKDGASPFWSDEIYGGHPIYAESQFAFLSPLNNILALSLPATTGLNVFHWLCLILSGAGMIALCRQHKLSYFATAFASLAVIFSSFWISKQNNLTISGALVWVPWAFWAFEKWLHTAKNIYPLILFMSLLTFAGYPQILHGAAIYMGIVLIIFVFAQPVVGEKIVTLPHVWWGMTAATLCLGLTAVQLLPLFELVELSHRKDGAQMWFSWTASSYRGLLYNPITTTSKTQIAPIIGSILVCATASAIILFRPTIKIFAYITATFILFSLGVGPASPLFSFTHQHELLPGLNSFRLSWPYFGMSVVGICLLAGITIDKAKTLDIKKISVQIRLGVLAVFWYLALKNHHIEEAPTLQYLIFFTAIIGCFCMFLTSKRNLLGIFLLILLVIEIQQIKFKTFLFFDNNILAEPSSISHLNNNFDTTNYRTYNISRIGTFGVPPRHPKLEQRLTSALSVGYGSTSALWDIKSMNGTHALPLSRLMLSYPILKKEIDNPSGDSQGSRLIDFLSIRYIIIRGDKTNNEMSIIYTDKKNDFSIVDNTYAKPRFQFYTSYQLVDNLDRAFEALGKLKQEQLIVEATPYDQKIPSSMTDNLLKNDTTAADIEILSSSSSEHHLHISTAKAGWLFLADTNYPGWKAQLDDRQVAVHSAQILGKSIWIPKGSHKLKLYFDPGSVWLGLYISMASFVVLLMLFTSVKLKQYRSTKNNLLKQ